MEIVNKLIDNGVDWRHTNKFGKTALDMAMYRKDKAIIDYLQNL